ncbi:drug/metabolite exporter YedA [Myxococcus dinghuensis]|uniref:drug/metabolite exporter YedA n=1 Tax=Myxococcus dinghuensis TaxID=2906761 RepID=UPI002B211DFE|nr:drug/metabolite exporter YedA [Myxococcus dinghuensis]
MSASTASSPTPTALPVSPGALPTPTPEAGPQRGLLILCLLTLYLIWGSTYLAGRWMLQSGLPPFLSAGFRFMLAGTLLFTVLRMRGAPVPTQRQWRSSAVVGLLLLTIGSGGVVFAQQWVPSGMAALVVGSLPIWSALFGGLFGQWPGTLERWGLALGFGGIVLLNLGGSLGADLVPTLALMAAPMSWAFGSILSRRMDLPRGMMASAAQMICGGALMLVFGLVRGEHIAQVPSTRGILSLLYLITFGSLIGYSAYGYLLRHASPALATSYAYVNPVVAVGLGSLLAGETMSPQAWGAMAAILGAVVLLTRKRR